MPYQSTVVEKRSNWTTGSKYFLFVFNVLSLVLGIVVLAMAIYIRADWTLKHYIYEMEAYFFWTGPYILMASSSFTMILSFFGCWATVYENPFLLSLVVIAIWCRVVQHIWGDATREIDKTMWAVQTASRLMFSLATGATALIGLGGAAYSLDHGTQKSKLTPWVTTRFTYLVFESDTNARYARIVRIMQEELGCCGGGGWQDYSNHNMEIPFECRNPVTGNMYVYGCGIIFSDYVEPLIGWMCGIAILLIVLQIFAIVAALILRRNVKNEDKLMRSHNKSSSYTAVKAR